MVPRAPRAPRGAHGQEHGPVEGSRLSRHHRVGQGGKSPEGRRHQQHAEEQRQFLPAQTREEAPQVQGTVVLPVSHMSPFGNVRDAGTRQATLAVYVRCDRQQHEPVRQSLARPTTSAGHHAAVERLGQTEEAVGHQPQGHHPEQPGTIGLLRHDHQRPT